MRDLTDNRDLTPGEPQISGHSYRITITIQVPETVPGSFSTISIGVRVSPEPAGIELLSRYNVALNYAINKILRLNLKKIGEIHNALYRELREWFDLPSRVALDCYRDALVNANA